VEVLDDIKRIESLLNEAAKAAETNVVASVFRPFIPQGVSGVVVIEESHLSIHTWPEFGYASVDFFTCGSGMPEAAHRVLKKGLKAKHCELMMVDRGLSSSGKAMKTRYYRTEKPSQVAESTTSFEAASCARQAV
jgi:S-adenosylmethionine decarboxylase